MIDRSPPNAPLPAAPLNPWRSPWRILISLLLAWHVCAVAIPPLEFITRGRPQSTSPFVGSISQITRPYSEALDLDHGYAFFAPEPGPLHLVRYKVEFADGRPPIEARFPNLQEERPRLMYHRYFMMSETMTAAYTPPTEPPRPIPPSSEDPNYRAISDQQRAQYTPQLAEWQVRRSQYDQLWKSLVAHLEQKYPGGKVTLTRVEHRLVSPLEFTIDRKRLNDPDTYVDMPEAEGSLPPRLEVLP